MSQIQTQQSSDKLVLYASIFLYNPKALRNKYANMTPSLAQFESTNMFPPNVNLKFSEFLRMSDEQQR
jgi:hypothetical protein